MTIQLLGKDLTVAEFFLQGNWKGLPIEGKQEEKQPEEIKLTVALTVQEFFKYSNWEGLSEKVLTLESSESELTSFSSPFSLSVSDFFQKVEWEGKPDIASLPKTMVAVDSSSQSPELNINDLSNLF